MFQGMAAVCLIPHGWGSFPQQGIPAGLCLWSTEHYRGATGNSRAEQQLAAAQQSPHFRCTTSVSFHSDHCAIGRNADLCQSELQSDLWVLKEWQNRNRQNKVNKHAVRKVRRNTPTVFLKLPAPIFMVWFIYLLKYCRNPGLVTQFSSQVYVKLRHPKWSFKPRVTDKRRDENKMFLLF